MKAEIDNHQCLKLLATWGPFHIKEFFGTNDLIIDPRTGQRLSPEILDALVQRFCYNSCICSECTDPFPPTCMCPVQLVQPLCFNSCICGKCADPLSRTSPAHGNHS
ncbi:hypothetical protein B0H14DRAFT_3482036 [Mycena olivaceomarginata]|nr:hypothetical protein B0H14DRAFT_3482036 [Mycena olivaceomarginata]